MSRSVLPLLLYGVVHVEQSTAAHVLVHGLPTHMDTPLHTGAYAAGDLPPTLPSSQSGGAPRSLQAASHLKYMSFCERLPLKVTIQPAAASDAGAPGWGLCGWRLLPSRSDAIAHQVFSLPVGCADGLNPKLMKGWLNLALAQYGDGNCESSTDNCNMNGTLDAWHTYGIPSLYGDLPIQWCAVLQSADLSI